MGDALHEALRMSPTWVVVGEVRGAYVISLLEAATSGISSVMCTIHARVGAGASSRRSRSTRSRPTPAPAPELVMASLSELDLVMHVHRDRHYDRYVSGIYELGEVGDSGTPSLTPIFDARAGERPPDREGRGRVERRTCVSGWTRSASTPLRWLNPDLATPDWRSRADAAGSGRRDAGVLLLTLAGLLICAGLVGVVAAVRGVDLLPHGTRRGLARRSPVDGDARCTSPRSPPASGCCC